MKISLTRWAGRMLVTASATAALCVAGCGSNTFSTRPQHQVLTESITSAEPDARRKALYEMSTWKDPSEEMVALVGLTVLGDSDAMARAQAARTLGTWGKPDGVRYLAVGLAGKAGDPQPGAAPASVQKTADPTTSALAGKRPEVDLSLPRLPDTSKFVRVECAAALGRIGQADGVRGLVQALQKDDDVDVRIACSQALKQIRSPDAARGLLAGLGDSDLAVRRASLEGLRYVTGQDFGGDVAAWQKFLGETKDLLAGYGHPPKIKAVAAQGTVSSPAGSQIRGIFSDLFPLERKEGPLE